MSKVVILYDTRTGNTGRMARAVAEGAKSVEGVEVVLKRVGEAGEEVMIEDEKAAINKYQLAIEEADSKKLKTVLEQPMGEEQVHIDLLEHEINRLKAA